MRHSNIKSNLASQRLSTREEETLVSFQIVLTLICSEINFNCRVTTRVKDLACTEINDPTSYKLDLICRANILFHISVTLNGYPDILYHPLYGQFPFKARKLYMHLLFTAKNPVYTE